MHREGGRVEDAHACWRPLFANPSVTLRVGRAHDRVHPLTQWSVWISRPFSTGAADVKMPLVLDDVESVPVPRWTDPTGATRCRTGS